MIFSLFCYNVIFVVIFINSSSFFYAVVFASCIISTSSWLKARAAEPPGATPSRMLALKLKMRLALQPRFSLEFFIMRPYPKQDSEGLDCFETYKVSGRSLSGSSLLASSARVAHRGSLPRTAAVRAGSRVAARGGRRRVVRARKPVRRWVFPPEPLPKACGGGRRPARQRRLFFRTTPAHRFRAREAAGRCAVVGRSRHVNYTGDGSG